MVFTPLNLNRLQDWIDAGRLDITKTLTMKDFGEAHTAPTHIPMAYSPPKDPQKQINGPASLNSTRVSKARRHAFNTRGALTRLLVIVHHR